MSFKIAIDGPAGAGKSTIARAVAARLGCVYIDTGAMYRAMALYMLENGVDPEDVEAVSSECDEADILIEYSDGVQRIKLCGADVTGKIRTNEVSAAASKVAAVNRVRERLVSLQRRMAGNTDVVMDGRDIGTVVLPDAQVKIFLTASVDVRARRRLKELQEKDEAAGKAGSGKTGGGKDGCGQPDYDLIYEQIAKRDEQDMKREISPLKQADDAVLLDTSDMNIDEVVEKLLEIVDRVKGE